MKRYLTFIGAVYYPSGGMNDFKGDFNTIDVPNMRPSIFPLMLCAVNFKFYKND